MVTLGAVNLIAAGLLIFHPPQNYILCVLCFTASQKHFHIFCWWLRVVKLPAIYGISTLACRITDIKIRVDLHFV